MSVSKRDLEEALVDGATAGLNSKQLFERVREQYPKVKTSKIVRAAFHALTEPTLKDRKVLDAIYGLALKHRVDGAFDGGLADGADDDVLEEDRASPLTSKAAIPSLPEADKKRRKKGSPPLEP